MNILIIGGGGREHAIAWKLKQSPRVTKLYCIPGNGGINEIAECHPEIAATDIDKILEFVAAHKDIGLTVVAPDDPLALGLVNRLTEKGYRAFGPTKEAALIEASKAFSKSLMKKYGIPTAAFETFSDCDAAKQYLKSKSTKYPLVVKADGLALGKGVIICANEAEALIAADSLMVGGAFGAAGSKVVIEEFLKGFEVSVLAFTDGKTIVPMISSQDHKRALDGDKGLNTGGMGTFAPSDKYTSKMAAEAMNTVFLPTIRAMEKEGRTFKGVIYFGLMIDGDNIMVLEYNARFGDPETQVILPLLENDLLDIFEAVIDARLDKLDIKWSDKAAVCVVAASGGYPESYAKGLPVKLGKIDKGVVVFHAGTAIKDNVLVTNGGRVLGVTAVCGSLEEARALAYSNIERISFDKMHYRRDICSAKEIKN